MAALPTPPVPHWMTRSLAIWHSMTNWQLLSITCTGRADVVSVLEGKIAIVTGTSRGVGVGIAHELLRAGATVIGCSRSPLDNIPDVEPDWTARASQKVCDQGDYRSIDSFVAEVAATHGKI